MSDLQCPATFLVLGSAEPRALEGVSDARLSAAYAVPEARARVADALGETGPPVTALDLDGTTYVAALDGLADLHRGETVLVVLPEDAPAVLCGRAERSRGARGPRSSRSPWTPMGGPSTSGPARPRDGTCVTDRPGLPDNGTSGRSAAPGGSWETGGGRGGHDGASGVLRATPPAPAGQCR